jgi:hypothetical protein
MTFNSMAKSGSNWLLKLGVAAAILAALTAYHWPNFRDALEPTGNSIPRESPDESRRIIATSGLSIVVPMNWDYRVFAPDELGLLQRTTVRGAKASIIVKKCAEAPPVQLLAEYRNTEFQGRTAFESMAVIREATVEDLPWSEYDLYLERTDGWWQISYGLPESKTSLPRQVRRYLETVRFPDLQ